MKQFLIKISVFIVLYLVLNQFFLFFSSYHWGNPWYTSKIQYLESKNVQLPNTYFFGSSRVYRQINPSIFDKLYNEALNDKRRSFNLGAPATFCPQTYYLYENFIKSEIANDVDLVFMELMPVNIISENLMLQERTTYWQNISDLKFVLESLRNNSNLAVEERFKGAKDYAICYAYNLFDINHLRDKALKKNEVNFEYIGANSNGYYSLDYHLEIEKDEKIRNDLIQRKIAITTDSTKLKQRVLELTKYHNSINNEFDKVNLERVLSLIDISKEKGIELVFVLPQIVFDKNLINLSKEIPKRNLIDLSDAKKFPQLYYKENVFDIGHLNSKGSEIFTELLVNQYLSNNEKDLIRK